MRKFINKEIFKFVSLKKYEVKNQKSCEIPLKNYTNSCEDWCEINIATKEPYIANIYFSHRGCLLSKACINAIISSIEHRTREDALNILFLFMNMLSTSEASPSLPDELKMFQKFSKFSSRKQCMLMGCKAIIKELNES